MNIVRLAKKACERGDTSSKRVTVQETLETVLDGIQTGKLKPARCLICLEDEGKDPYYYAANVTFIQALGLLEFTKLDVNDDMRRGED